MDKVRGWEEKFLSGVMQPSLDSHFHLHITANALFPIHFSEFWSVRQLREHPLSPEALFWELRSLPSTPLRMAVGRLRMPHRLHHCQGWDVTTWAFCGPMSSLQRSWVSSGLGRAGCLLGEVCRQTMAGDCIYRPGSTGSCRLYLLHIDNSTRVKDKKCLCVSFWPPFWLISSLKKNKNSEINVCILRISKNQEEQRYMAKKVIGPGGRYSTLQWSHLGKMLSDEENGYKKKPGISQEFHTSLETWSKI